MRFTRRGAVAALLAATTALAACTSDSGPTAPDLSTLDATAVAQQQSQVADVMAGAVFQSLFAEAQSSVPVFGVRGQYPVQAMLTRTAAMLAAHTSAPVSVTQRRALVEALTAQSETSWIPTTLLGETFTIQNGVYAPDTTRHDAPANGVNIVLYERGTDGSFGSTAIGLLKLVDNSTASVTSGTATILDGSQAVLGTLNYQTTQNLSGATGTVTGTIGIAPAQLLIADTASASVNSSGTLVAGVSTHTKATFANVELHVFLPNLTLDGSDLTATVEVTVGDHVVRIDVTESASTEVVTGKVYINDFQVGVLDPNSEQGITDPSGEPVAPQLLAYFSAVAALTAHVPVGVDLWSSVEDLVNTL